MSVELKVLEARRKGPIMGPSTARPYPKDINTQGLIMKNTDAFLIAHVEHAKARFTNKGEDLGIEFKNHIDTWMRIEVHLRHKFQNPGPHENLGKQDLSPLVYSFRARLDKES